MEARMPSEPQDEEGTGSSYAELVEEADVPRVGDEGVEGVAVAGQQLAGGGQKPSGTSAPPKASASKSEAK